MAKIEHFDGLCTDFKSYNVIGCFFKKVLHKHEEKMQEKLKMTYQKDKNLAQVQAQCNVCFCIKTFFE